MDNEIRNVAIPVLPGLTNITARAFYGTLPLTSASVSLINIGSPSFSATAFGANTS